MTGCRDGRVRLWDTETGDLLREFVHPRAVDASTISPDGLRLATGCNDSYARLWSLDTGEMVGVPLPHPGWVFCVAFSPDGRLLASTGLEFTAHLWDVASGKPVCSPSTEGRPWVVEFSPDGRLLAVGCHDSATRVWRLPDVPHSLREMELITWTAFAARLDANSVPEGIPADEWRKMKGELAALDDSLST